MATLYDFDFEYADLAAFLAATSWTGTGTPVISSAFAKTGTKSIQFNPTGYTDEHVTSPAISKAQAWIRFWVYITAFGGDGAKCLASALVGSSGDYFPLMVNTTGTLAIHGPSAGTVICGPTTAAISLNTWTEVWCTWKANGASSVWEIKIGAETKTTATSETAGNITSLRIGPDDTYSDALTAYVDVYTADDAAYPTDGGAYPSGPFPTFRPDLV